MAPDARLVIALATVLALGSGCSERSARGVERAEPVAVAAPTFVNRVWRVAHSSGVEPGALYTFLSEGTLVIASPHNRPAIGSWSREGEGLVMVEESLRYPVDILAATADSFSIRMHNPGEPVLITFVPAESLGEGR